MAAYEITKVPKGRGHAYAIDGQEVERVTNIVKAIVAKGGGFEWFLKTDAIAGFQRLLRENPGADYTTQAPRDILKWTPGKRSPLTRGTAVHAAAELGDFDISHYHPDDQPYITALAHFHETEDAKPDAQELIVGSKEHRYAGTCDWRGTYNGQTALLDWKTVTSDRKPVRSYPEHHLQLAAYELASIEMGYDPTETRVVVYLLPDGSYHPVEAVVGPGDWLCALDWYRALAGAQERLKVAA